ncbi:hypothetical protein O6H91_15G039300 [Diphasiastrum complanatum]|uniref:Uncharacterized protein n=1 Tax=Diphasiastrum complanatum TaxID=34168 RepID=A0ACC2BIH9_DIPCM|nr:hypothetical protein O6H91_15G039300 [Diphasiastrum complanatum]
MANNGASDLSQLIKDIEIEKLQGPSDSKFLKIGSLWESQTVVLHILRRFGCRLCRANALELSKIVPDLESQNIRVIAVGLERLGMEEFLKGGFWKYELYLDEGKKLHQALNLKSLGVFKTLNMILTDKEVKTALQKTKEVPGDLKGDGRQLGATLVFAKGGAVLMDFRQRNFADHPTNASILEACGIDPGLISEITKNSSAGDSQQKTCDTVCS